jgi:hypothetical protein
MAEEARGENPAVVKNENVARFQVLGKIAKVFVLVFSAVPIQNQHARSRAVCQRFLSDELPRKMKIEVGDEHEVGLPQRPGVNTKGRKANPKGTENDLRKSSLPFKTPSCPSC